MIKVLIVDDHDLVRAGIRRLLADVVDIDVIGESCSGEESITACQNLQPDVVLMDIHMPGMGGMEAIDRILKKHKDIKIIVLTAASEAPMSKHVFKFGVSGYLTKGCDIDEMVTAIKQVKTGQRYISAEVATKLAFSMVDGERSPLDQLSRREIEVLIKIGQGMSNREIAEELHLSPKTTSTYRSRLLEKLGASNDVELTKISIAHGLHESTQSE